MRYDYWRREAQAWGKLKALLGHFSAPGDKARYERRIAEILDEIARQVRELSNGELGSERVASTLDSEAFAEYFDRVLTHWDEIRSAKGYVKASLRNMVTNSEKHKTYYNRKKQHYPVAAENSGDCYTFR